METTTITLAGARFFFMTTSFGDWLRGERISRRLTLEALSERTKGELTHVAIGDWERGKREPKKPNLQLICAALLGDNATQEQIEQLFRQGWAALGGIAEIDRIPSEEELQRQLMAYAGDNPILSGARGTAEAVAGAMQRAGAALTGEEPDEVIVRGRRKGITVIDE